MRNEFLEELKAAIDKSRGKIPVWFIDKLFTDPRTIVTHVHPTETTRVCIITLPTGHELVGYAQVMDPANDDQLIGQEIAYERAKEKVWQVLGAIGKVLLQGEK